MSTLWGLPSQSNYMTVSQTGHSFLPSLCSSKYWSALCYYRLVQTTMNWRVTVNIAIVIHQGSHKVCGPLLSGSFPSREVLIFWNHPFWYMYKFGSVYFSHSVTSDSFRPHGLQHARPPCLLPTPRAYSNSYPLSRWCQPTISPSVVPFSSHLQSFSASRSFQMSQFFT